MNMARQLPGQANDPMEKPDLFGKLSCLHVIVLFLGGSMIIVTAYERIWIATIAILLFLAAGILLTANFNVRRHNRLTGIWSELARLMRLEIKRGRACLVGTPEPPSLNGIYRNRQVSIVKLVQHEGDYEGTIPVVFTRITFEVANAYNRHLDIRSRPFLMFLSKGIPTGNKYIDKHFTCEGNPDNFIQKTAQWVGWHPSLLQRPDGVIMLTDSLFSFTNWTSPSIHLENSELTYLQSGVVSNVPEQVNILNLLCDLAELIEEVCYE